MKAALLTLALLCGTAHAQHDAIAADAVSTVGALSSGATELNPLGWATGPLRLVMLEYAKTLPPSESVQVRHSVRAGGYGAAANNVAVMVGIQGAPVIGIFVGIGIWASGREEREFWAMCDREREHWGRPDMSCTYTPGPVVMAHTDAAP